MTGGGNRFTNVLRHLKSSEPKMDDSWMETGKRRLPKTFLKKDFSKNRDAQIEGLLLAIELLAKKCAYLESRIGQSETETEGIKAVENE